MTRNNLCFLRNQLDFHFNLAIYQRSVKDGVQRQHWLVWASFREVGAGRAHRTKSDSLNAKNSMKKL